MNKLLKKSLAFLLALVMVLSVVPVFEVSAATVDYEYGYDATYGEVIKNWGKRGELATFLSPKAESFYSADFYDTYVQMSGSSNTSTVTSSTLYTALYKLMDDAHTTITDYDDIKDVFQYTDCENSGNTSSTISGFYSGIALTPAWDGGLSWNREHTWPQSKSATGDDIEDIMSIRPESSSVNSSRGNKGYGASSTFYDPNSVSDKYDLHGDVARVILYTYVRWGGESTTLQGNMWGSSGVFESKDVLLQWMEEDPVDTWEMGRNDSVQSITGTRNVFVDYPELAFVLFGDEIPQMDTPSGKADSISYTITPQTNNSSYGTVSVNNSYITAHPAEGYKATGYEVVSGSATVTQNGNIFTVSATGNCTIRINFAAKEQYTATFMEDGKTVSTQKVYEEYCVTMPSFSGTVPTGYTFRGWVDSIVYNTSAKPVTIYAAGSERLIDSNTTFYALLSYVNENDTSGGNLTYKLVTSANQLSAGTSVVIVAADSNFALSTTQNTNNRGAAAITKGTDTLVFDGDDGVQVLTLVAGTVSGTYGLSTGGGYLYAASSGSNHLKTSSTLNDNGSFKITVNEDGSHSVIAQGANSRNTLLYNSQSNLFSCYSATSSNVKNISIYYGVSGGTTYYTTAWTYVPTDPEETEPETTVPAVTEPAGETTTLTYVISDYDKGIAYAENEAHKLDDVITVIADDAFFTTELRLYENSSHNSTAIIQSAEVVDTAIFCVGNKTGILEVYGSVDGIEWTLIENVSVTSESYVDYTVDIPENAGYTMLKLDAVKLEGATSTQLRIKSFSITLVADEPECDHEYRECERTEATCTQPGSITYGCPCGAVYTEQIPALGHTEVVDEAVAATYTTTGLTEGKHCSVCDEVTAAQEEIPVLANPVSTYNVSLSDNIGVNFEMNLNASDKVAVTVNGKNVDAQIGDGKFSIELAAAQMTDEIAITVNGLPLEKTYSVRGYADTILNGNYTDADKNMVKYMLNYGGAAQTYFGYNTGNMANKDITVDAVEVPAAAETELSVSGSADGITFYGASLVYRDKIAIRFYFTGSADGIKDAVVMGDMFYIEVADILPQNYDQAVTVEVGGLTVSYSPMNYIVRMNVKGSETAKALVQALYGYYAAAKAYTTA